MITVGLTGGIGTGKSEVGRILRQFGASFIDADELGHQTYLPHTDGWQAVVNTFGKGVLQADGQIDRKKLGAIVFNDSSSLAKLNAITHPRIANLIKEGKAALASQGLKVAVIEAAILIEAGWAPLVDEVWVVTSNEQTVVRRLQASKGLTKEAALARIHTQLPQAERVKHAQVVLENNGDLEQVRGRVHNAWQTRIEHRIGEHVLS